MADNFGFNGDFSVTPLVGSPSFEISAVAPINESLVVKNWKRVVVDLTTDNPTNVSFDQLASADVVIMRVREGGPKVTAQLVSNDGVAVVPFEYYVQGSKTTPVLSISLTRVSGTATKVEVFLGEKA